jgi:CP family cyanate transporter-like MFS transporter
MLPPASGPDGWQPIAASRWLVLAGVLLMAFSARLAVAVVSPVLSMISGDLPFDAVSTGVLGLLPTAGFALMGFLTPLLMRRVELEPLLLISLVISFVGQLGRSLGTDTVAFLLLSLLTMVGLGLGNIVLPPLVKRYFPHKVGLVTALYVTLFAFSTALTPQLAVPLADAAGWRFSVGVWSAASVVAAGPWVVLLLRDRAARIRTGPEAGPSTPGQTTPPPGKKEAVTLRPMFRTWRSSIGWGLALVFAGCSSNTFALFIWLPSFLVDAGLDAGSAGSMLALYAITGLPTSLIVPLLVARMQRPFPVGLLFTLMFAAGYAGLLVFPITGTALWVFLAGLGQGTYSFALLMVNKRTSTTAGSGALSGFAQGVGYSLACLGPLLFGFLQDLSGSWLLPFAYLGAWLLVLVAGLLMINRPRMLEDGSGVIVERG